LSSPNRLFDQVDGGVILICGGFVTNQVPDTFLNVQLRMVRRQILDFDIGMGIEELSNSRPLMPGSPINVEINFRFLNPIAEVV